MELLESKRAKLKIELLNQWDNVIQQLKNAQTALISFDKDLAHEIILVENKINKRELKIDDKCETYLALYNPVAIDLRFVLAVLKINSNLERVGDMAEGIADLIIKAKSKFNADLMAKTEVDKMIKESLEMLTDVRTSFHYEDTNLAKQTAKRDKILNKINENAVDITVQHLKKNQDKIDETLKLLRIIHKVERTGDYSKNIAEQIQFYVDAKVIKHKKTK